MQDVVKEVKIDKGRLTAMQELRGIDNKELARRLGINVSGLQRIKQKESTSMKTLGHLCDILDCHPFDLLVATGYPEPFLVAQASL